MFTTQQLDEIDVWLQEGLTPAEIATRLDLGETQFRYHLAKCGRVIKTYRRLEMAAPADAPRELTAA